MTYRLLWMSFRMLKKSGLPTRTKSRGSTRSWTTSWVAMRTVSLMWTPCVWRTGKCPGPGCGRRVLALHLPAGWELFAALFTFDKIALQWKESPNSKAMILMSPISCKSTKRTNKCLQATYVQSFPAFSGWVRRVWNSESCLLLLSRRQKRIRK